MDTTQLPERFRSKIRVNQATDCWDWMAARNGAGYGRYYLRWDKAMKKRITIQAHRFAYEFLVGPIEVGLEPDHTCRNPGCCNPAHLEVVTHQVNVMRGTAPDAARAYFAAINQCPHGHPYDAGNTFVKRQRLGYRHRSCRECSRIDCWLRLQRLKYPEREWCRDDVPSRTRFGHTRGKKPRSIEARRQAQRDYRAEHREAMNARLRERRHAAKQAAQNPT